MHLERKNVPVETIDDVLNSDMIVVTVLVTVVTPKREEKSSAI